MIIDEGFSLLLYGISFDVYGAERASRADIFTTASTYTNFRIYMWNCQSVLERNHRQSLRRTMFRTSSTTGSVTVDDAVLFDEDNLTQLCQVFLLFRQWQDSSIRTNIPAYGTIKITETLFKENGRLHHSS